MKDADDNRTNKTFKQGLVGGVLGAFVGAPGLGMGFGMAHANKDKIKKFGEDVDNNMNFGKPVCRRCGRNPCRCRQRNARENPADWL